MTARSGIVRRSLREVDANVLSSTTTNCSGLVREPAPIWKVGKPPTDTARSSDHFTSLAVTGVPSWNTAFFFSLKVGRHVADVHVVGELHLELVLVVIRLAVRAGLHLVADQAVVAIPRDLVARHVGADAVDVDIVRAAFRNDQDGLGAALRLRGREDRGRRQCGARRTRGRRFQEIATLHQTALRIAPAYLRASVPQGPCQHVRSARSQGSTD